MHQTRAITPLCGTELRRRAQRFTKDMLLDYTAAVGLRSWDENFYTTPFCLITNTEPPFLSYTLEEARVMLGIPPHCGHHTQENTAQSG